MRFAYADPPYHGYGKSHYGETHAEAAVWDNLQSHLDLLDLLMAQYRDGWALSANPKDLHWILGHLGDKVRVCAWAKTFHQIRPNCSVQYAWEPVVLYGGRQIKGRKPMVRDWMACARSMKKGLRGAKPDAFNKWVLDLLGYQTGDELVDLFPGTGGMAATLANYN